ncbi:hypothetical protein ACWDBD_40910, partial [Streptomyces sp. NPDC001118]
LVAFAALASISTATGGRVRVQVKPDWHERATTLPLGTGLPPAPRRGLPIQPDLSGDTNPRPSQGE